MTRPKRKSSRAVPKAVDSYHHGDLRQALVDAAFVHTDREGPDSVSLAQLARALGVSQPAPYRHFADRTALLAAVATRGFEEFSAALQTAFDAGRPAGAPLRMGKAYVDFGTKRPGIYRLMFASAILVEAANDTTLTNVARGSFGQLVAALEDTKDRELRALKIWVALHGLVMLFNQGLLKGDLQRSSLDALVEDIFAR